MSEGISRRSTLKSLGAAGATMALGGVARAQAPAEARPATSGQARASLPELAVERMAQGHS